MPEVVYMKNDQKMELIEKPRRVVDDDMMYFCNQDDVEDDESCESLFEGFDGDITKNSNTISDSGIDQSESMYSFSERSVNEDVERTGMNECRKVGEKMDKLKLKLEKKMTGLSLQLNESANESGFDQSFSDTAERSFEGERENKIEKQNMSVERVIRAENEQDDMKKEFLEADKDLVAVKGLNNSNIVDSQARSIENITTVNVQNDEKPKILESAVDKNELTKVESNVHTTVQNSSEITDVKTASLNKEVDGNDSGLESSRNDRSEGGRKMVKVGDFSLSESHKAKKRKSVEAEEQLMAL